MALEGSQAAQHLVRSVSSAEMHQLGERGILVNKEMREEVGGR